MEPASLEYRYWVHLRTLLMLERIIFGFMYIICSCKLLHINLKMAEATQNPCELFVESSIYFFDTGEENFIMTSLAAALENAGITSFRFDFTGNGESEGSFEFGSYWREADDIYAVAQHFHKANRTVIAFVGHSKVSNNLQKGKIVNDASQAWFKCLCYQIPSIRSLSFSASHFSSYSRSPILRQC
ncbi:hypothetical protein VNO78_23011 [Psophocarpus tetragonolobus]|uniref:Serine aminopeptidase S33 domain-containing protein n=1 Tax=Psophocarpus tetragonolobus TaxID=3891 RepID=A0AAN9S2Z8_PSOTE